MDCVVRFGPVIYMQLACKNELFRLSANSEDRGTMSKKTHPPIPVNIISGPLGVGKTTTINHLLAQRPAHEKWAVLVNEYGLVGLDAAFMESATATEQSSKQEGGVEIKEVAGGCICCSAGFMFEVSLVVLLQRRPDRLIVEPTGLAALSGILDTLERRGIREAVDVRSVVCLLDPVQFKEDLLRDEVQDQVEAADILLANRTDLASASQIEAFDEWANNLFPPKRHIANVTKGSISLGLLDLVIHRETSIARAGQSHGTDHHHEHHDHLELKANPVADQGTKIDICDSSNPIIQRSHRSSSTSTIGWICWDGLVFDAERTSCWLSELSKHEGTSRAKAVLRTNEGWWGFNFAKGLEEVRPSGYRRDSRLELIIDSDIFPDIQALEQALRACLLPPTGTRNR